MRSLTWVKAAVSDRVLAAVFCAILLATALDAYNLGGFPIPWLAQAAALMGLGLVLLSGLPRLTPGLPWYLLLLAWSLFVTAVGVLSGQYASLQPPGATTPYPVFIGLRLLVLVSFVSFLLLVWRLLELGRERDLVRWTVVLGVCVAAFAIYVYLAQVHGWPEPARTRMGTGGQAQPVRFSYDFHRALGTFREPSLLAAWLIVPLFYSFVWVKRIVNVPAILIAAALLLTGSTTGVLAVSAGLAAGLLLNNPLRRDSLLAFGRIALNLAAALVVFKLVVVPYDDPIGGRIADDRPEAVLSAPESGQPATPAEPAPSAPANAQPPPAAQVTPAPEGSQPPPPVVPTTAAPSTREVPPPVAPTALAPSAQEVPPPVARVGEEVRQERTDLGRVLLRRLRELVTKGPIAGSNRDYVYRFVREEPPGLLGVGLGNANLVLTRYLGKELVVSYLSLYVNFAYATGIIGCFLLLAFLLQPLFGALRRRAQTAAAPGVPLVAAVVGWFVVYAAVLEELTLPFALAYAMLAHHVYRATQGAATAEPGRE